MSSELDKLLALAKQKKITPAELELQRKSFAYGNTNIENDKITRDTIERAAAKLKRETTQDDDK